MPGWICDELMFCGQQGRVSTTGLSCILQNGRVCLWTPVVHDTFERLRCNLDGLFKVLTD